MADVPLFAARLAKLQLQRKDLRAATHALWFATTGEEIKPLGLNMFQLGGVLVDLAELDLAQAAYFVAAHSGVPEVFVEAVRILGDLLGEPAHLSDLDYVYPVPFRGHPQEKTVCVRLAAFGASWEGQVR